MSDLFFERVAFIGIGHTIQTNILYRTQGRVVIKSIYKGYPFRYNTPECIVNNSRIVGYPIFKSLAAILQNIFRDIT